MNESLGRRKKGGDCRLNRKKNKEGYIDMTAWMPLPEPYKTESEDKE